MPVFRFVLLLVVLLGTQTPAWAQASGPEVLLNEGTSHVQITPAVLDDPTGILRLEDVEGSAGFSATAEPLESLNTGTHVRWLRWTVRSTLSTPTDWYLDLPYDEATVFLPHSGTSDSLLTGTLVPVRDRSVAIPIPSLVRLTLGADEPQVVYVRLRHRVGSYDDIGPITMTHAERFNSERRRGDLVQGILLGCLLALAAYNLLLFLTVRDRSYLFYVLYLLGCVLYWSANNGHIFELIWPASLRIYPELGFAGLVVAAAGYTQFSRLFLDTPAQLPRFDRVLVALLAFWGVSALLGLLGLWGPAQIVAASSAAAMPFLTAYAGYRVWRLGSTLARYYLYAVLVIGLTVLPVTISWFLNGAVADSVRLAFQVGTIAEAMLLALALSYRIRLLATERLETREALKKATTEREALHATNEIQTHLLGLAAHDLRSPLTGIVGFADLIESETADDSDHHQFAAIIKKDAERMLALINDLLVTAALDGKNILLERQPVDLGVLTAESMKAFEMQADQKGQRVQVCLPDIPTVVSADPIRLRQVLDNLISNAIKYSPPGGAISIEVRQSGDAAWASVTDSGPGLSAEDREHLFERFTRLSAQPTGGEGSTGLGLSIVRELAELHGGRVDVESTLGAGSTFSLVLPGTLQPAALPVVEPARADMLSA